jgi:hypothetical protein
MADGLSTDTIYERTHLPEMDPLKIGGVRGRIVCQIDATYPHGLARVCQRFYGTAMHTMPN